MSIRLRLTLVYTAILVLTLVVLDLVLYGIQAQFTLNSLKSDLRRSGDMVAQSLLWRIQDPQPDSGAPGSPGEPPPPPHPAPGAEDFKDLREREIVRVLDAQGQIVARPEGRSDEALPLSADGLQALQTQLEWWEIAIQDGDRLLVYNLPLVVDGQLAYIVQAARYLDERDRSLQALGLTLVIATLVTALAAFGIGWALAGMALRPIQRITQTAQAIESGADLSRRVDYAGPNDEVGQLATTFNSMLARLQAAYQQVSHALKMQRDFVADVSHELRTPLTTVRGNLGLLRRMPPLPPDEQADILADVVEESDRLIRLVNDLLVLARADSGRSLAHEPVAVPAVIAEACRQARPLERGREISEQAQDLTALGDRDALKQVLLILLDNALKHTDGAIRVQAQALTESAASATESAASATVSTASATVSAASATVSAASATVSAASADDWVELRVCDEGPGIPPELAERLFDRFYRGAEPDPSVPGFGLGLPIARALVEGQGGRIKIESQPGQGTCVQVLLPRWNGEAPG